MKYNVFNWTSTFMATIWKSNIKMWWFLLFFPHFCCLETFRIISFSNFWFLISLLDKILPIKKCLARIQKVTLVGWPYLKAINMKKMNNKKIENWRWWKSWIGALKKLKDKVMKIRKRNIRTIKSLRKRKTMTFKIQSNEDF